MVSLCNMENSTNMLNVKDEFIKTCEICFKLLDDISSCETLDAGMKDIIEILFIKSEVQVNPESVICSYCSEKLREAFDFKTMCIETEDILVPFIDSKNGEKVDVSTVFTNLSSNSDEDFQKKEFCRLCGKSNTIECMIPFKQFLEDPKIMEVFERHIPEMVCIPNILMNRKLQGYSEKKIMSSEQAHTANEDIKDTKNPFVCNSCINVVKNFSTFLLSVTELNKGICLDDHQLPSTSSFPMKNNSSVTNCSNGINVSIKTESEESHNEINNFVTVVTKLQNSVETSNTEPQVPFYKRVLQDGEWVYVRGKPEEAKDAKRNQSKRRIRRKERKIYTCEVCNFKTKNIQSHRLLHADLDKIRNFKCSECSFVSKYLHSIKRHMKIHEKIAQNVPTQTKILKCPYCSYATINTKDLKPHVTSCHDKEFRHKYECPQCDYWTYKKFQYDFHLKKHRREDVEGLRKCNLCDYKTRYKNHIKRHMAYHATMTKEPAVSQK